MNLRDLSYFLRVVEHGSFTRAAQRLRVAQPALTRHVQALEAEFRTMLLVRGSRGVTTTEAGQHLYESGVRILRDVERAQDEMQAFTGVLTGRIVVGLTPSLCPVVAPPLLVLQRRELPRVELKIVESYGSQLEEWLVERRIDLAVFTQPQDGLLLRCEALIEEEMVLVTRQGARPPGPISAEELSVTPLIMTDSLLAIAERLLKPRGVQLMVETALNAIPTILLMAGEGLCSTIVPFCTARPEATPGGLRVHRLTNEGVRRSLVLGYLGARRQSLGAQAVAALIRKVVGTLADGGTFVPESASTENAPVPPRLRARGRALRKTH